MKKQRVIVIGAGVSGLAASLKLCEITRDKKIDLDLTVLESTGHAGGSIETFIDKGFVMEGGPDCFITEKPAGMALVDRLGLTGELISTNKKFRQAFILQEEKLFPVPEGFNLLAPSSLPPLMRTSLLSWRGKLRAALEAFIPSRKGDDDESIADFVERRLGKEILDRLASPLLGGVYNSPPQDVSLLACLPRFRTMEKKYGSLLRGMAARQGSSGSAQGTSGARYSLFVTMKSGLQTLTDRMAQQIPEHSLIYHRRAERIEKNPGGTWTVHAHKQMEADAIILAIQPSAVIPLMSPLSTELQPLLSDIPVNDAATLNLAYRRDQIAHPLDGFGFVANSSDDLPLLGCTFSSQKFEGRAPEGHVLIRVFLGSQSFPAIHRGEQPRIEHNAIRDISRVLKITGDPILKHFSFYPNSMTHYRPGHIERVASIRKIIDGLGGLALAGNGLDGTGIPDCIASGETAAQTLLGNN